MKPVATMPMEIMRALMKGEAVKGCTKDHAEHRIVDYRPVDDLYICEDADGEIYEINGFEVLWNE